MDTDNSVLMGMVSNCVNDFEGCESKDNGDLCDKIDEADICKGAAKPDDRGAGQKTIENIPDGYDDKKWLPSAGREQKTRR